MAEGAVTVVAGIDQLEPRHGPLFAVIGVFDGIHRGHQYLFRHLVAGARQRAARPAVITFDSHPDEILVGAAPPLLLDPADRLRLLGEAGVEVVIVQHFDAALRSTEYDEFVHRIKAGTSLAGLLMTPDAAFGHDRRGTADAVAALGEQEGFDVVVVPPFELDGRSVRSADIRAAIASGDLRRAELLLGRPHSFVATAGEDDSLRVALPVALPQAGEYRITVGRVDESAPRVGTLIVEEGGALRLEPRDGVPPSSRLAVAFHGG